MCISYLRQRGTESIQEGKLPVKPPKISTSVLLVINYYEKAQLRQIIDEDDYKDLLFLKSLDKGVVLAEPIISNAITPIAKMQPATTSFILNYRKEVETFFSLESCDEKNEMLGIYEVDYILTKEKTDCGWELIYEGKNFLYAV